MRDITSTELSAVAGGGALATYYFTRATYLQNHGQPAAAKVAIAKYNYYRKLNL